MGEGAQPTDGGARACIPSWRSEATDTAVPSCRWPFSATSPGAAELGGRGSGATGAVHKGQCCTSSPGLVLPGVSSRHPLQRPTPMVSRPGSVSRTIIDNAGGNTKLLSSATKASHVAVARQHPRQGAVRSLLSSRSLIRLTNRAFCVGRFTAPGPERAGPDHLVPRPARHKRAANPPAGGVCGAGTVAGEALRR